MGDSSTSDVLFWLIPGNDAATQIVMNPDNSGRRREEPLLQSIHVFSIHPHTAKIDSRLVTFGGAADTCDIFLAGGDTISENQQCYFDFHPQNPEILFHNVSPDGGVSLRVIDWSGKTALPRPKKCVVEPDKPMLLVTGKAYFILLSPSAVLSKNYSPTFLLHVQLEVDYENGMRGIWDGTPSSGLCGQVQDQQRLNTVGSLRNGTECRRLEWADRGKLGQGAQGNVLRVVDLQHGDYYALKIISKESACSTGYDPNSFIERIEDEIKLVNDVAHPNIVQYFHHQGGKDGAVEIFMPVYQGSLYDRIQQVRELQKRGHEVRMEWAWGMLTQILTGLSHIHSRGKIHRDVKPGNILFHGDKWILADFGIAKILDPFASRFTKVSTEKYRPPEFYINGGQTTKYDIYGLGLCFLECFVELNDETKKNGIDSNRHDRYMELMRQYAPSLKEMLLKDSSSRLSADGVLRKLSSSATLVSVVSHWPGSGETKNATLISHDMEGGDLDRGAMMAADSQPYPADMSWEPTVVESSHPQLEQHTGFGSMQEQTLIMGPTENEPWSPGAFFVSLATVRPSQAVLQPRPQPEETCGWEPGQQLGATNTRASLTLSGVVSETSGKADTKRPISPTGRETPRRSKRIKTIYGGKLRLKLQ